MAVSHRRQAQAAKHHAPAKKRKAVKDAHAGKPAHAPSSARHHGGGGASPPAKSAKSLKSQKGK